LILNEVNPQLTSSRLLTERVTSLTPATTGNSGGGTAPLGTGGTGTTGGTNTTGGGTITTAPATPPNPPVGSTKVGFYPLGTVPGIYLPYRPAPAPTEIICTESACDAKQTQCLNSGGLILFTSPKQGVLICSKTQTTQMRCDEFVEQTERTVNGNIVKDNYPLRNCTPQLKKCYELTPAIQKSAWINGTVSCTTNI
jgi:hypothetical protein